MRDEWSRLRAVPQPCGKRKGCWDEDRVQEWCKVRDAASTKGEKIHVGRVFGILVEKGSELVADDPRRKFKGRAVFGGNDVRDEAGNWAIFQDLGSCPATMDAARAADAYGCFEGHDAEQADAEQAYTQATLVGTKTWVRLPKDEWPASWHGKYHDPVCPLVLALYGHPDSGGHWEQHCEKALLEGGYTAIPGWKSCYWHASLKLMLIVYVDDFKLAGPKCNLAAGWKLIRDKVKTDQPHAVDVFLGCKHEAFSRPLPDTGKTVRGLEYNM